MMLQSRHEFDFDRVRECSCKLASNVQTLSLSSFPSQAKEFGEAEVWMNERLMRAAPGRFADFVTAFEERPPEGKARKAKQPNPLWLIWRFEGDWTLWNLMQKRDFPYNTEVLLLGQEVDLPKGPQRSLLTIRLVMTEVRKFLKTP